MESRWSKNRTVKFLFQCLSLSSPVGITVVFGFGILALFFLDPQQINFPDLCIIKRFFNYCPACGTTRALMCFFKGEFAESISYNCNVIITGPLIIVIFLNNFVKVIMNWRRSAMGKEACGDEI